MNKAAFEKLKPVISQIRKEEIFQPNMPVKIFILEAEELNVNAEIDRAKLLATGMEPAVLDGLKERIDALTYAQSIWEDQMKDREEAQRQWMEELPKLRELKDRLEHAFRFAFRRRPDLINKVQHYEAGGSGYADLFQDLSNLSVTGYNNLELLKAINFDVKLLDEAAEKSSTMKSLLARANGEENMGNLEKIDRDRYYTYLKWSVDEIRETGKYVFWKEDRARLYASDYHRERQTAGML